MRNTVIELIVNNHPGVMSHLSGLFARRRFNLEAILCVPIETGVRSRMLLLVDEDARLDQLIKQIEKLYDVITVSKRSDIDCTFFRKMSESLTTEPSGDHHITDRPTEFLQR